MSPTTFAPKHLLVPVDSSATGDRALADALVDDAAAFAKMCAARVTLVHIEPPDTIAMVYGSAVTAAARAMVDVIEARNAASARTLRELEERVRAAGVDVTSKIVTRPGSVPETIVATAVDENADAIVIATHARRGVRRILLGSVAERTAHLSQVPVLLLPAAK